MEPRRWLHKQSFPKTCFRCNFSLRIAGWQHAPLSWSWPSQAFPHLLTCQIQILYSYLALNGKAGNGGEAAVMTGVKRWRLALDELGRFLASRAGHPGSSLEFLALIYLSLPVLVFFVTFTAKPLAIVAPAAILLALWRVRPSDTGVGLNRQRLLLSAGLAALFLVACGYGPLGGRSWDWLKHFAIINELADQQWPPVREDTGTFLRYALGYYMFPGLLAKWLGKSWDEVFVFLQTWVGLTLLLMLLLQKTSPKRPLIFVTVFLLFSGLDLLASKAFDAGFDPFAHHEWWARLFAYEGHATLFLWVPQHALAGLLGIAILLPGEKPPPSSYALLGISILFWSPFAAIGLAPFAAAAALQAFRPAMKNWSDILCGLLTGIPLFAYLTSGSAEIPQGWNWELPGWTFTGYLLFLLLECGLLLLALRVSGWKFLHQPALVMSVLIVLPLYRMGLYNDFTMRACIPALGLLAIAAARTLSDALNWRSMGVAILMVIGGLASLLEMYGRAHDGTVQASAMNLRAGFLADNKALFIQYNAPLPHWVLRDDKSGR